jgi:Zn-dependent protease
MARGRESGAKAAGFHGELRGSTSRLVLFGKRLRGLVSRFILAAAMLNFFFAQCSMLDLFGFVEPFHTASISGGVSGWSWWSLAGPGELTPDFLILGVIWYIVFLFSTTCHEGAHSLIAKLGGDSTAFHGGQVTLNPLPHIRREPFGLVVVPILSYFVAHWMIGWASAPYDPEWQARYPRRAAWMALGGPAANFSLVLLSAIAIRAGIFFQVFGMPDSVSFTHVVEPIGPGIAGFAATFLSIVFVLNLLLGTFNLLPVPPLDGNTGITLFMNGEMALRFLNWSRSQGFGMIGLLLAWYVYDKMFPYIFRFALAALYPGSHWG